MALPKLFQVNQNAKTTDVALLITRLLVGITLFLASGAPKLAHLSSNLGSTDDSLHLGGFFPAAVIIATLALGICTLLVVVGLATRYAALLITLSLAGTGLLVDHVLTLNYLDPGHNSHPEVVWLYFTIALALVFTGPGRYSVDRLLSK